MDDPEAVLNSQPAAALPAAEPSADAPAPEASATATASRTGSAPPLSERTITVGVPGGDDAKDGVQVTPGITVYSNSGPDSAQAVQTAADGATRFLTVLSGPDAPSDYHFTMGLAAGVDLQAQANGSVTVVGSEVGGARAPIATIAAPWAVDAAHHDLPAHFTVEGADLVLHVDQAGAVYPVTADPEVFFFHYFSPASPYASGGSMFGDSVGYFTSQVDYRNMSRLTMQWGFKLSYQQQAACSHHRVSEFARVAAFGRMTRYQDGHPNESCDYQFHSSMSSYTYADDRFFPTTHYLHGYVGMPLNLWVSLQFQTGPRSVRQVNVYANYVL